MTWPVPPAVPILPMIGEDDVLGGDAGGQVAVDRRRACSWPWTGSASASPARARPRRCRCRAPARRRRRAWRCGCRRRRSSCPAGETLLGPDDVDDALPAVELVVIFDAEFARRSRRAVSTCSRLSGSAMPPRRSVVWMLWSTTASVFSGARTLRPRHAQALERLRARHLVDEMAVDIDEARAALRLDDVVVPDLVIKRARLGHYPAPAPVFGACVSREGAI